MRTGQSYAHRQLVGRQQIAKIAVILMLVRIFSGFRGKCINQGMGILSGTVVGVPMP